MAILDCTSIADLKSKAGSKPLSLDKLLNEENSGQNRTFRYSALGTEYPPTERLQPLDPTDVETVGFIDEYEQNKQDGRLPIELYRFDNYYTFGYWALIADLGENRYVAGPQANWSNLEGIDYGARDIGAHYRPDSKTVELAYTGDQIIRVEEPVALLIGPGYGTYGHWLVDFLPKLQIFQDCGILGRFKIVLPGVIIEWVSDFLSAYGIEEKDIFRTEPGRIYHWKTLFSPSWYRKDGWFGKTCQTAWSRMITHHAEGLSLSKTPPRIYASRRNLPWNREGRVLSDYPSLLKLFDEFDIHEFFPEDQERQEQVAYFTNADVVIGEDGSALHNCIFCRKPATMIVLMAADTGREYGNHLGLANCLGLKVALVQGPLTSDSQTFDVDTNRLRILLEQACRRR